MLPFALGKIAVVNRSEDVIAACARWVLAIDSSITSAEDKRVPAGLDLDLMSGTPLLQDYVKHEGKHYCTFLKELRQEMPVSQQLRIPLVSLEQRHLSRMGQANVRVQYIQNRYNNLVAFLVDKWKEAPMRQVNSNELVVQQVEPEADIIPQSHNDLNLDFKKVLDAIAQRAGAIADELNLVTHDEYTENQLTEQMVDGQLGGNGTNSNSNTLSVLLHEAGFAGANVLLQRSLSGGTPDIILLNVIFPDHANSNLPIVFEVKKVRTRTFNSGSRRGYLRQVRDYRNQLPGHSPYSILLNFVSDSRDVQILWCKVDGAFVNVVWHEYTTDVVFL